jgi:hypothetical protein
VDGDMAGHRSKASKSRQANQTVTVRLMVTMFAACAFFGTVGTILVSCSADAGGDSTVRASATVAAPVPDAGATEAGYLAHLSHRGVMAYMGPRNVPDGEWIEWGRQACRMLEGDQGASVADAIDTMDLHTTDHMVSAVVVDAAIGHLCDGVDL